MSTTVSTVGKIMSTLMQTYAASRAPCTGEHSHNARFCQQTSWYAMNNLLTTMKVNKAANLFKVSITWSTFVQVFCFILLTYCVFISPNHTSSPPPLLAFFYSWTSCLIWLISQAPTAAKRFRAEVKLHGKRKGMTQCSCRCLLLFLSFFLLSPQRSQNLHLLTFLLFLL